MSLSLSLFFLKYLQLLFQANFFGLNITSQCFSRFLDVNVIFPQPVLSSGACREREWATISFQVCRNKNPTSLTSPWSIFLLFLLYLSPGSAVRTVITPNWITHSNLEIFHRCWQITFRKIATLLTPRAIYLSFHHVWNPFRHLIYPISLNYVCLYHRIFLDPCTLF